MGRGAHDIMLDDLYASMEEAASPVIREKVRKWYSGTIYNRLEPDGAIVLINHRMHEDNLSGRLTEKMKSGDSDADQWTIIRLPALADDKHDLVGRAIGEPFCARAFRSCRSGPHPRQHLRPRLVRALPAAADRCRWRGGQVRLD